MAQVQSALAKLKGVRASDAVCTSSRTKGARDEDSVNADESIHLSAKSTWQRRAALSFGAVINFSIPPIFTYWCVRFITAGNSDLLTVVLLLTLSLLSIMLCCHFGCCRLSFCGGALCGTLLISVPLCLATLFNHGELIHVNGHFNATKRIAVVGAAPSGSTAVWALSLNNPDAVIDLYEYNPRVGGHSDTVVVEGGVPIDIGFIFSTPNYTMYNALCSAFNLSQQSSTITVHYHGEAAASRMPWTNLQGGAGDVFTQAAGPERASRLASDIERFMSFTRRDPSLLELMVPLDYWLVFNGFSEDFFHSALVPMLTPLFVTQHGNSAQSSGATLTHFHASSGFLAFNASEQPPVFHGVGGVQRLYEKMLAEAAARSPRFRTLTSTEVTAVAPSRNGWRVSARSRDPHAPPPPPVPLEYDEVVLATNAHIAARLLSAGGDGEVGAWPPCEGEPPYVRRACAHPAGGVFRAFRSWAMRNTEYEWSEVTLSKAAADDPTRGEAKYHIFGQGVMTGSIDRILDVQPAGSTGDYRLRVAPIREDGTQLAPDSAPDANPPLALRRWQHHRFNLWEHLLVFRVLHHFNDFDGLHVAGDWTQSIGQDAAVRSGLRAACAVGLSNATKDQLRALGMDPALVLGC